VVSDSTATVARRILAYVIVSFGLLALLISGTGLITYAIVQLQRSLPWMHSFVAGWVLIVAAFVSDAVAEKRIADV
jgi:uncharacterized membrane protein